MEHVLLLMLLTSCSVDVEKRILVHSVKTLIKYVLCVLCVCACMSACVSVRVHTFVIKPAKMHQVYT